MIIPYGPEGGIKNTIRSPRAEGEARGLSDGIFDATQGPIWYCYYLVAYFMKNICKSCLGIGWHQKMAFKFSYLKISQKIRQNEVK